MSACGMEIVMVEDMKIKDFLEVLSSKEPVPGGGGASALVGAIGDALGQMVANLTIGKKKYADVEERTKVLLGQLEDLQGELVKLADEDAKCFAPLAKAYSLPSGTDEEKEYKARVMEENLVLASRVPLDIMERCMDVLGILDELSQIGSRMAISDVGVAVQCVRAGLLGAVMNVYINTKSMKNRGMAEELNAKAKAMVEQGTQKADLVYDRVLQGLL
jgi:formiminotetrahydrofolate cyclodeaminase